MASGTIPNPIGQFCVSVANVNASSGPETFTIPGDGNNYLLFTTNNNSDSVTMWFIRPNTSVAIKLIGGNNITVTMGNSRSVTVTSAIRNVGVYLADIG